MVRKLLVSAVVVLAACGKDKTPTDPGSKSEACTATNALSLTVGEVSPLPSASKTSVCVSGGAGSEYALIPVYTGDTATARTTLTFTGTNTAAITGATIDRAGFASPLLSLGASGAVATPATYVRNAAFDERLRADEHALFDSHAVSARAAFDARVAARTGGARLSRTASLPSVGDYISLNANADQACSAPMIRTARVVAITSRAIVVADTLNPTGGFTDAEYQSIGASFDTLAFPVDTFNFGAPADIDNNGGRSILFFTKAVNDLTPLNSTSYVGGFFYGRDLYPQTATNPSGACATSNVGELFYLLVPDPTRAGNSTNSPFTKDNVKSLTVSVLAHEFQHLINLSRRLYVTRTSTDEVTWLNEGLSHVAEELVFYRSATLAPRQNISLESLRAVSGGRAINAFNQFELSNFGRLLTYLPATEKNSPFADNDSLETRGATWQLLRYSADRKAGTERDTWYALVNSSTKGILNMQNVFGAAAFGGARPWLRDWAVSNFTDDAGLPVPSQYTQPSWNYRSLTAAVNRAGTFPLVTHQVVEGTPVTVTLGGGGVSYLRFRVPSNTLGSVAVTAASGTVPAGVDVVLVRTQ